LTTIAQYLTRNRKKTMIHKQLLQNDTKSTRVMHQYISC